MFEQDLTQFFNVYKDAMFGHDTIIEARQCEDEEEIIGRIKTTTKIIDSKLVSVKSEIVE